MGMPAERMESGLAPLERFRAEVAEDLLTLAVLHDLQQRESYALCLCLHIRR